MSVSKAQNYSPRLREAEQKAMIIDACVRIVCFVVAAIFIFLGLKACSQELWGQVVLYGIGTSVSLFGMLRGIRSKNYSNEEWTALKEDTKAIPIPKETEAEWSIDWTDHEEPKAVRITPLQIAAKKIDLKRIDALLAQGITEEDQRSTLQIFVASARVSTEPKQFLKRIEKLIELGAKVDGRNIHGDTAHHVLNRLHDFFKFPHYEEFLAVLKTDVVNAFGYTPEQLSGKFYAGRP